MEEKIMEKVHKHPRSMVAKAYNMGLTEGRSLNILLRLAKLCARRWVLMNRIMRSKAEDNQLRKITTEILNITK